jgi:GT2 family glycosyltransferase
MIELSIIFVNWNSTEYLRQCLESVYALTKGIEFEIIVVDNASPQNDVDSLKVYYPSICLIKSAQNVGFAAANNIGFAQSSGKYVLFLNPDTKIIGDAINVMLSHIKSIPDAGIVSCRQLNAAMATELESIQPFPTILNRIIDSKFFLRFKRFRELGGRAAIYSTSKDAAKVDVVPGTCVMLRREVFAAAGQFNTDYFMYAEDIDLCYSVRQLGLQTYFAGDASIIHYGGSSSKQRGGNAWVAVMQAKAVLKFCERTRGRFYAAGYRLAVAATSVVRLIILGLLIPFSFAFSRLRYVRSSFLKWFGLLKWATGLAQ